MVRRAQKGETYSVDSKKPKSPHLICSFCNEIIPLRSNQAIFEELTRISSFLSSNLPSCPNSDCNNSNNNISLGSKYYYVHGKTRAGSTRYKCRTCGTTFAHAAKTTLRQRKPHLNRAIFLSLVNQSHLSAICRIQNISFTTLYGKIDWLYRRCLEFAASREKILINGVPLPKLNIGVDRQFYTVNWTNTIDKRNIYLHAIGSADNTSRYVFAMNIDFDPSINLIAANIDATLTGDYEKNFPYPLNHNYSYYIYHK